MCADSPSSTEVRRSMQRRSTWEGRPRRINFWAFFLCELFMGPILYPSFGCWVWGGGWMSQLGNTMGLAHGYVDFAGSTVVHGVGGVAGGGAGSPRWRPRA